MLFMVTFRKPLTIDPADTERLVSAPSPAAAGAGMVRAGWPVYANIWAQDPRDASAFWAGPIDLYVAEDGSIIDPRKVLLGHAMAAQDACSMDELEDHAQKLRQAGAI